MVSLMWTLHILTLEFRVINVGTTSVFAFSICQLEHIFSITIIFNPLMHNVPKWSYTLSTAFAARFLNCV